MKDLLNVVIAKVQPGDLTLKQLEDLVKNFDLNKEGYPAVTGHPQSNSPAYGWVKKLWIKGKSLLANFEVVPEFFEWLEKKLFKNRSISYYPNYQGTGKTVLRHVGWLGGTPPQIKGMPPPLLLKTDEDFKTVELDERDFKFRLIGDLFQNFRDWLIEEVGLEIADRLFSIWSINDIRKKITEVSDDPDLFIEKLKEKELSMDVKIITYTEDQHKSLMDAALQKQKQELTAASATEIVTLTTENTALKTANKELKEESKKIKAEGAVIQLISGGRLHPKEKDLTIKILMSADEAFFTQLVKQYGEREPVIEFGENPDLADYGKGKPNGTRVPDGDELPEEERTYDFATIDERIEKRKKGEIK